MVFKLIRSLFGIDSSDDSAGEGTDVPIESGSGESAARGTDAAGSTGTVADTGDESTGAAEPAEAAGATTGEVGTDEAAVDGETPEAAAAAGTDASGSTGSVTAEPPADDTAAEPAEAAGPTEDDEGTEGVPVEEVNGIGPAYAQRLTDAGIETVGDLLAADPEAVADATDLSPKRISRWQEAADPT